MRLCFRLLVICAFIGGHLKPAQAQDSQYIPKAVPVEDNIPVAIPLTPQEAAQFENEESTVQPTILPAIPIENEELEALLEKVPESQVFPFEITEEDEEERPLTPHEMALVGAGGVALTLAMTQAAQKLLIWYDQRKLELAQSDNKMMIKAEIEKLEYKIQDLKSEYSWLLNRLAAAGIHLRFSAAGDLTNVLLKKATGKKLQALEAELSKSQNDFAFKLKEIADARAELERNITIAQLKNAQQALVEVKQATRVIKTDDRALSAEQKIALEEKQSELQKAENALSKESTHALQSSLLQKTILPYLNGGAKASNTDLASYKNLAPLKPAESALWQELHNQEKTLSSMDLKLSMSNIALASLEFIEKKHPSAEGSKQKQLLIEARKKNVALIKKKNEVAQKIKVAKTQLLAFDPANHLAREAQGAQERAKIAEAEVLKIRKEIEELKIAQSAIRSEVRQQNESSARDLAEKHRDGLRRFRSDDSTEFTDENIAEQRRLIRLEAEANQKASEQFHAIEEKINITAEAQIQSAQKNAAALLENMPLGQERIVTDPALDSIFSDTRGSSLPELLHYKLDKLVEEKRSALTQALEYSIENNSMDVLQSAINEDPEKNLLVLFELLHEKNRLLSSQQASPRYVLLRFRQKLNFVRQAIASIDDRVKESHEKFKQSIETGPERKRLPTVFEESFKKESEELIRTNYPAPESEVKRIWHEGDEKALVELLKDNPYLSIDALRILNIKAAEQKKLKLPLSPEQKSLIAHAQADKTLLMKRVISRLKDTKQSAELEAEIWLMESLQSLLGYSLNKNPTSLYEATNGPERKALLNSLLTETATDMDKHSRVSEFTQHADNLLKNTVVAASALTMAKRSTLTKINKILQAQGIVHRAVEAQKKRSKNIKRPIGFKAANCGATLSTPL